MSDPEQPEIISPPSHIQDWYLAHLVRIANLTPDFAMGITLVVGGAMVTGQLVSGVAFFRGIEGSLVSPGQDETEAKNIRAIFTDAAIKLYEDAGTAETDPAFIHLRSAQVFHPGAEPIPAAPGIWWRGRLSAVDGFWLGTLQHHQPGMVKP